MTLFKLLLPALAFSVSVFAAENTADNFGSRSAEENGVIRFNEPEAFSAAVLVVED